MSRRSRNKESGPVGSLITALIMTVLFIIWEIYLLAFVMLVLGFDVVYFTWLRKGIAWKTTKILDIVFIAGTIALFVGIAIYYANT